MAYLKLLKLKINKNSLIKMIKSNLKQAPNLNNSFSTKVNEGNYCEFHIVNKEKCKCIKVYATLLMLIFTTSCLLAQTKLTGVVRNEKTNNPVAGENVIIKELQLGTITDNEGKLNLEIPYGEYTVVFSSLTYETVEKVITCNQPKLILNMVLQPSVNNINEVKVTAKSEARKIREQAMPISVISMQQLQGTVSDVSDVLSKTAGVTIRASGGVGSSSRISVRGLEGKRIGFYIDETPMNDNSDFVDINDIPVDLIERVEVYKGIVPAKFGGSSIGGAVNIVLKEYPPKYLDASYSLSSFNTHKYTTVLKSNKNDIEIGIGGFYTYSDNNYKMHLPDDYGGRTVTREHDQFKKYVIGGGIKTSKWWFDNFEVEPNFVSTKKQIQGIESDIRGVTSFSDAFFFAQMAEKSNFLFEGLDLDLDNSYSYSFFGYEDKGRYKYSWDGTITDTHYEGINWGEDGEQPNSLRNEKHTFYQSTNLNYVVNKNSSVNLNSLYRFARGLPKDQLKDLALGYKTNFNSNMHSWTLGLCYEFNTTNKKFTSALNAKYYSYSMKTKLVRITDLDHIPENINNVQSDYGISEALRYRFSPSFLIKASAAYDVRLPSDNELLGDGYGIVPASDLIPERNTSFNIGLILDKQYRTHKRFQLELNGFYNYLVNMIRFTGGPLQSVYQNFGKMRSIGAEMEIKWDATQWLYLWGNTTYQDLKDARKYDPGTTILNTNYLDRMPNIPYFFVNGGFELHKENLFCDNGQNSRLFTDFSFIEEYFHGFEESKLQEKKVPQSFTIDIGVEHSIRNQSVYFSLQANNITDARVMSEFNRPLPGRNFGAKIRYVMKEKGSRIR